MVHILAIGVVVGNKDNNIFLPDYMCQCNEIVGIANDLTNAISEVYSKIFATKTRYSGSLIMGWNDENIVNELNKDVPFTPHSFLLEKIKVFVYGVGYSTNIDWHCAGLGYKSSLLHKFGDKQALFVSKIEETLCTVEIYQDQKLQTTYVSNNPIDVWKNLEFIKKFNGNQLFGIDNHIIKSLNKKQKKPTCSSQEWKDDSIMKSLFDFHLKRRTIVNINWHQLFIKWDEQESPLIELKNELHNIYPENHQFSIREKSAWQTFLYAAGANNVTPWPCEEQ
ncbi:10884_t:CDS:2, partial [Funneliformis caledonium]